MKQRSQIITESLHNIALAVNQLREDAVDLGEAGVNVDDLNTAIETVAGFVSREVQTLRDELASYPTDDDDDFTSDRAVTLRQCDDGEDPPCIACGAPESACECGPEFASFESMGESMSNPKHICDFCATTFKESQGGECFDDGPIGTVWACDDCSGSVEYCTRCETAKTNCEMTYDGPWCLACREVEADIEADRQKAQTLKIARALNG